MLQPRHRPFQEQVCTRPGLLSLTYVEDIIMNAFGQKSGIEISLGHCPAFLAYMPAVSKMFTGFVTAVACLRERRGPGIEFEYLTASICGFAAKDLDKHARGTAPDAFTILLLKSPIREVLCANCGAKGKNFIGKMTMRALPGLAHSSPAVCQIGAQGKV